MQLFVVYWVDLDDACLKRSVIKIIGVYDDKTKAEKICDAHETLHCKEDVDHRCQYAKIKEIELNEYSYTDDE